LVYVAAIHHDWLSEWHLMPTAELVLYLVFI